MQSDLERQRQTIQFASLILRFRASVRLYLSLMRVCANLRIPSFRGSYKVCGGKLNDPNGVNDCLDLNFTSC